MWSYPIPALPSNVVRTSYLHGVPTTKEASLTLPWLVTDHTTYVPTTVRGSSHPLEISNINRRRQGKTDQNLMEKGLGKTANTTPSQVSRCGWFAVPRHLQRYHLDGTSLPWCHGIIITRKTPLQRLISEHKYGLVGFSYCLYSDGNSTELQLSSEMCPTDWGHAPREHVRKIGSDPLVLYTASADEDTHERTCKCITARDWDHAKPSATPYQEHWTVQRWDTRCPCHGHDWAPVTSHVIVLVLLHCLTAIFESNWRTSWCPSPTVAVDGENHDYHQTRRTHYTQPIGKLCNCSNSTNRKREHAWTPPHGWLGVVPFLMTPSWPETEQRDSVSLDMCPTQGDFELKRPDENAHFELRDWWRQQAGENQKVFSQTTADWWDDWRWDHWWLRQQMWDRPIHVLTASWQTSLCRRRSQPYAKWWCCCPTHNCFTRVQKWLVENWYDQESAQKQYLGWSRSLTQTTRLPFGAAEPRWPTSTKTVCLRRCGQLDFAPALRSLGVTVVLTDTDKKILDRQRMWSPRCATRLNNRRETTTPTEN